MILEGFEIDHWSCIQHLAVHDLPSTGVVVLHGPNGTGKSSIVAALRACLMDYSAQTTAKELKRYFPKTGDAKPRVSVTFRSHDASWRITKQFGSKNSKLEKRNINGTWTTEASTATDAHDQTRQLLGGKDSDQGLHQLLWLTQAEYQLPAPKEFDADVQSQLRSVLGVLQTPLDDRFVQLVDAQFARWFNIKGKRKKESGLEKNLAILAQRRTELESLNAEFLGYERMLVRAGDLEIVQRDLCRQLDEATRSRDALQAEYERSLIRIEAHRLAADRIAVAERALDDANALGRRRNETETRLVTQCKEVEIAREKADAKQRQLELAEAQYRTLAREAQSLKEVSRKLHAERDAVFTRQQVIGHQAQLQSAREKLEQAERLHTEVEAFRQRAETHAVPEAGLLARLETNRAIAAKLRLELDAAALTLSLIPEVSAAPAVLTIDGSPVAPSNQHAIRRSAELIVPGWGRIELARGSDARELDSIEGELATIDHEFFALLAPFGIPAGADALDRLRMLVADHRVREPERIRLKQELERLAPGGLDPLRQQVARIAKLIAAGVTLFDNELAPEEGSLDQRAARLKSQIDANDKKLSLREQSLQELDREINGHTGRGIVNAKSLRQQNDEAKTLQITLHAVVEGLRNDLERMLTANQIAEQIVTAEAALSQAQSELAEAALNENELTIKDRLAAAKETVAVLDAQIKEADKEYHGIEAVLSRTEGLHSKRAAAAALVEELTRQTEREMLESDAVERLRALFEESRDKQFGAVLGPIHDRVLRWMKLLRIGGYQSMRFNDSFLPDALVTPNAEFAFDEESTGTIEQMALMVRLALGATLSRADDPVTTVLDDPLTHSDSVRLNHMRAVLRSAATGDASATPPAGPMQILVFTCHPEWFRLEDARVIDLANLALR